MSSRIATLKRLAEQLQASSKARADACTRLADAYWSGIGVEKDEGEAVKWMIKAS
jgi:TPR repeat protein